jgi:hypothetical protein
MREAVPRPDSTFRMRGWAIGLHRGVQKCDLVRDVVIKRDDHAKRVSSVMRMFRSDPWLSLTCLASPTQRRDGKLAGSQIHTSIGTLAMASDAPLGESEL